MLTSVSLLGLLPLIILTLVMGKTSFFGMLYPEIFLDPMHLSCSNLLAQLDIVNSY